MESAGVRTAEEATAKAGADGAGPTGPRWIPPELG